VNALGSTATCAQIAATLTSRPQEIDCEEDGCWWSSPTRPRPTVTCNGDVATLVTEGINTTRDCSRAFAHCDPSSATGCTDRAPVGCDPAAVDRCDGDVRIGCDHTGRVSFHDCTRYPGGHCQATSSGSQCVYDQIATCYATPTCSGDVLQLCVAGTSQNVDCKAIGMTGCLDGHCVAN
jgi:hypothetical protein